MITILVTGIDGLGNTNSLAKFIYGGVIGNSSIFDDGENVTILGSPICTVANGLCTGTSGGSYNDTRLNSTTVYLNDTKTDVFTYECSGLGGADYLKNLTVSAHGVTAKCGALSTGGQTYTIQSRSNLLTVQNGSYMNISLVNISCQCPNIADRMYNFSILSNGSCLAVCGADATV